MPYLHQVVISISLSHVNELIKGMSWFGRHSHNIFITDFL